MPRRAALVCYFGEKFRLSDLLARLTPACHTIAYFKTPLPEPLLDSMRLLAGRRGHGSLDLVVEKIDDVAYLKKLQLGGASVYNGVGLPQETLIIIDRDQGYWLTARADGDFVAAHDAPDLYLKLLWRRFGLAVSYEGELKEIHPGSGFFRVGLEKTRFVVPLQRATNRRLSAAGHHSPSVRLDQVEQPDHGSLGDSYVGLNPILFCRTVRSSTNTL
jgi:hypothetical protein